MFAFLSRFILLIDALLSFLRGCIVFATGLPLWKVWWCDFAPIRYFTPIVRINASCGPVRGLRLGKCSVFLGLPYAFPCVGPVGRWAAPQLRGPWATERDARHFGPEAMQMFTKLHDGTSPPALFLPVKIALARLLAKFWRRYHWFDKSDDCLYLNVFSPVDLTQRSRLLLPVLVWVHGGAFVVGAGSAPMYARADALAAAANVVVVTLNYRLGALGFARVDGAPDNRGLLDIMTALQWVRQHASGFGGDPLRITAVGQSAGAMALSCLLGSRMMSPQADPIISGAILMSGALHTGLDDNGAAAVDKLWLEATIGKHHRTDSASLGDNAGTSGSQKTNSRVTLREMAALELSDLMAAERQVLSRNNRDFGRYVRGTLLPFVPIVTDTALFPFGHPLQAIACGMVNQVPVLMGTMDEENNLFIHNVNVDKLPGRVEIMMSDGPALAVRKAYKSCNWSRPPVPTDVQATSFRIVEQYSDSQLVKRSSLRFPLSMWSCVMSDIIFRVPMHRLAEAMVQRHLINGNISRVPSERPSVYLYRIDHASPTPISCGTLGAAHAIELPLLFKCVDLGGALCGWGRRSRLMSDVITHVVASFCKHGVPAVPNGPEWQPIHVNDDGISIRKPVMIIGAMDQTPGKCKLVETPDAEELSLWDALL